MASICVYPRFKAFDSNGQPLKFGLLYSYVSGTGTPKTLYSDFALTQPLSNPLRLDGEGEATIYLATDAAYRFILHDRFGIPQWPEPLDNVQGIDDVIGLRATVTAQGSNFAAHVHNGTDTPRVDVASLKGVTGPVYKAKSYASLAAALTAIGAVNQATLEIEDDLAGDDTIPTNVTLLFVGKGRMTGNPTINGPIIAPARQIFTGQPKIARGSRNAAWFGAIGDGVLDGSGPSWTSGTDNTAAFQRALDSFNTVSIIRTNGDALVIPGGVYRVDGTLTVDAANIQIRGDGNYAAPVICMLTASDLLFSVEVPGVQFENLTLRGDGVDSGGGTDATVTLARGWDSADASNANVTDDLTFRNCAIQYAAVGVDVRGRNTRFHENNFSHCAKGIHAVGATSPSGGNRGLMVQGNRFHSFGFPHTSGTRTYGIFFESSAAWTEPHIVGNYFDDCETAIGGVLGSGNVDGNTIQRNGRYDAIDLSTVGLSVTTKGVNVTGNAINFQATLPGGNREGVGIRTNGALFSVAGNMIHQTYQAGIKIAGSSAHVVGNTLYNTQWASGYTPWSFATSHRSSSGTTKTIYCEAEASIAAAVVGAMISVPTGIGGVGYAGNYVITAVDTGLKTITYTGSVSSAEAKTAIVQTVAEAYAAIEVSGNTSVVEGNSVLRDSTSSLALYGVTVLSGAHRVWANQTQGSGTVSQYSAPTAQFFEPQPGMRLYGTGQVRFSALPTSASGLSSGDLWNNAGVVNIVP